MSLALKPATLADLPAIALLMNLAYRSTGPGASWNTEAPFMQGERTSEALLQAEIAIKPQGYLLVAYQDEPPDELAGCVWLEPVANGIWYLGSLTVDPTLQNSGLGRALLTAAEQWAAQRGARILQMTVIHVRETLIAWYQRRGYHRTGEVRPFPYGDTRFGVPLRDDLTFVVLEKALR